MATKTTIAPAGMKPVEQLTGKLHGKRFTVVLDAIKINDVWDPSILPVLVQDGIGKTEIKDGVTYFTFKTSDLATIEFRASQGKILVNQFFVKFDEKEEA